MSEDAFRKAEDQYFLLRGELETGRLTQDQFEAAIKDLMVQDSGGRYWMLGADTGKWYVHNWQTWVEADPYGGRVAAPQRGPLPRPFLILVVALLVPILLIGALLLAANQGLINLNFAGTAKTATPNSAALVLPSKTAPPTTSPTPSQTIALTPTSTARPSDTPSPTPSPQPTLAPTNTPTLPATAVVVVRPSATRAPTAPPRPTNTPTLSFAPGVYVTALRSEPAEPKNVVPITFFATFTNTTGGAATYRWFVLIWDVDNSKNSFGHTSYDAVGTIPPGVNELAADNNYRVVRGGECHGYWAQVMYVNQENAWIPFTQPDGSIVRYDFQVCP